MDGGGSRWCKHIHVVNAYHRSLLPFNYGGDGGERWDLCWKVGELAKEVVSGSS